MWLAFWLVGCEKEPEPDKGSPTPTGSTAETAHTGLTDTGTPPGPDLVATDGNDLTLDVSYAIAELQVRPGFDALVTWSTLTTDGWGAPVVPAEVPRLVLLEITVPPSEVADRLAKDDLGFELLSVWEADVAGGVFAQLSDLRYLSTPFDPAAYLVEDGDRSWVLGLARPSGERLELLTAVVLVPTTGAATSQIGITDGQSTFGFTAALDGAPLVTADVWDAWTLDWSGLATDALGRPFDRDVVDELFVARTSAAPSTLGDRVRDLPGAADEVWRMEVGGFTDARLEFALDAGGAGFPGFTEGSTWLVGGRCTTCLTPFPAFVFTVDVR